MKIPLILSFLSRKTELNIKNNKESILIYKGLVLNTSYLILPTFLALLFMGCGGSSSPKEHILRKMFDKQLSQTKKAKGTYDKQVVDLNSLKQESESLTFKLSNDSTSNQFNLLNDELYYATLYMYNDDGESSYLQTINQNDTIIARPLITGVVPLQLQKVLLSSDGNRIKYIESQIVKDNWLYTNSVHIWVSFDSLGYYKEHGLEVITDINLVREDLHGIIKGEISYE